MAIDVTGDNFEKEVIQSEIPVVIDFWGPRCGPCLALMPHVEKLETVHGEKVKFTKVDSSKNRRLSLNLKVMSLPTFLFYKKGSEVERLTGNIQIEEIKHVVERLINNTE